MVLRGVPGGRLKEFGSFSAVGSFFERWISSSGNLIVSWLVLLCGGTFFIVDDGARGFLPGIDLKSQAQSGLAPPLKYISELNAISLSCNVSYD